MADHLGQADQQWLVGSCCSVADIALYAYVHEAEAGGFTVAQPIQSWLARCEALLGWVSVTDAMETERDRLPATTLGRDVRRWVGCR